MATDYAPFVDFKQRKCLQAQRNVSPENVTGTNTSAAAMIKIARTRSTAVVQHLHTVLVAGSNPAVSTKYVPSVMAALWSPKPAVKVRVLGGVPKFRLVDCVKT